MDRENDWRISRGRDCFV